MRLPLDKLIGGTARARLMTSSEKDLYDPAGLIEQRFSAMTDKSSQGTPCEFIRNVDDVITRYQSMREKFRTSRHSAYYNFDTKHDAKLGLQGGCSSYGDLMTALAPYYVSKPTPVIDPILLMGRNILMQMIQDRIDKHGYPRIVESHITGTFAGCPTSGTKGTFEAEVYGMPFNPYYKFYPVVPWYRDYRQAIRSIFMDSNVNVKSTSYIFSSVRKWLSEYLPEYFDGWRNPAISLRKRFTEAAWSHAKSIEWDYMKMDTNVRETLIRELIIPIYSLLLKPYCSEEYLMHITHQMFNVPLIIGSYLVEGEHSLLSGMNPTNDWETLYTVILALGVLHYYNILGSSRYRVNVFAMGDDMTMTISSRKFSVKDCEDLLNSAIEISNKCNMIIHPYGSKSVIRDDQTYQFCRQLYYLAGVKDRDNTLIGSYPGILTLNSILYPEHPSINFARFSSATLQRLDGLSGTFTHSNVCDIVLRAIQSPLVTDAETLILHRGTDWWERVYGERWNPTSSKSYQYLISRQLNK